MKEILLAYTEYLCDSEDIINDLTVTPEKTVDDFLNSRL